MSEPIGDLVAALVLAKADIKPPTKGRTVEVEKKSGGKYSFTYADRADVIEAYKKPLSDNGLAIVHTVRLSRAGTPRLVSRLVHKSGQEIRSSLPLPSVHDAQTLGSWLTYLERYQACALLDIAAEDDDGGQNAVSKPKKQEQRPAAPPPPPNYECISREQGDAIQAAAKRAGLSKLGELKAKLLIFAGVDEVNRIPAAKFEHVVEQFNLLAAPK